MFLITNIAVRKFMCVLKKNGPQGHFVLSFNINVGIYSLRFIVVVSSISYGSDGQTFLGAAQKKIGGP